MINEYTDKIKTKEDLIDDIKNSNCDSFVIIYAQKEEANEVAWVGVDSLVGVQNIVDNASTFLRFETI